MRIAWEDVQTELAASADLRKERAEEYREMELQRLDAALAGLALRVKSGDPYAADVWRKVSESRRRLLGLDAPTKLAATDPTGRYGAPIVKEVVFGGRYQPKCANAR